MSGEILQDFSCEFIHEGDSCKLVDFLVDENRRLRAARDVWVENNAKLRELVRDMHTVISDRNSWWDCMCKDTRRFADRMRELGVEVDDA